jgi:hypothetical protein
MYHLCKGMYGPFLMQNGAFARRLQESDFFSSHIFSAHNLPTFQI